MVKLYKNCEYDNIDDCLFFGTNDCEECPFGYNFDKREIDIQSRLDSKVLESRTENDWKRNSN